MRFHRHIITLSLLAFVGVAVFVGATSNSPAPVTLKIVKVTEMQDARRVTVEFLRSNPAAHFSEAHQLQVKIAGRWQPPLRLPKLEDGYLLARTDSQQMVFDFPLQSEACRFSLGYRVGRSPYCQTYFFLSRHGISKRFPVITKATLKCVPRQPRLRHAECELEIPAATHDQAAVPDDRLTTPSGSSVRGQI
jgi:hypothetical protein